MSKLINYVFSGFFKQDSSQKIDSDAQEPSLNHLPEKNLCINILSEGVLMANSNSFVDLDKSMKHSNDNKYVEYFHKERLSIPECNQSLDLIDLTRYISMYEFESIICMKQSIFKNEEIELDGNLILTNYRITFIIKNKELRIPDEFFSMPILSIIKLDKIKIVGKVILEIQSKENQNFKYLINEDDIEIYNKLSNMILPKDPRRYYDIAYIYKKYSNKCKDVDGWNIYSPVKEYERQKINLIDKNSKFRFCLLNKEYEICDTYPDIFVTPQSFSDDSIKEAKNFRTKNRIPALCWMNFQNQVSIWRSSQTKSGITHQRSNSDEKLLEKIREFSEGLIIFDARPYLNALANRLKGAGFENTDYYENTKIQFCEIDNIHAVRNSLVKMYTLCKDTKIKENKKFYSQLELTGWYDFIQLILKSCYEVYQANQKKFAVLIHCSDGWDRSTQLITISEILLDPYYRTIEGFIILIEKEWLSFGHQFGYRNGIYIKEVHEDQRAPIFLQWLDCIHQLLYQFPSSFEFNMDLLLFLTHHSVSCLYGTFLFNNEKERKTYKFTETVSIWTDVIENIDKFKNPFYDKNSETVLNVNFSPLKIRFWEEYFLKYNFSYATSFEVENSFNKKISIKNYNHYVEIQKRNDKLVIENQKNTIGNLRNMIKEIYKLGFIYNFSNELSEESKRELKKIIENDSEFKNQINLEDNFFNFSLENKK